MTIEFTLPENRKATLKVHNALGWALATLVNEKLEADVDHQVGFDAARLATGMYFFAARVQREASIKKPLLMK